MLHDINTLDALKQHKARLQWSTRRMTRIHEYSAPYKEAIAKFILAIQNQEFRIPITLKDQPDLETISSFYQSNKGNFWVALLNNEVIGTIALLDIGKNQGALRKMFVKADYRGKRFGVAQRLLDNLLHWAQDRDFKGIYLGTTEKFLAAQRFYEKNGFIEIEKDLLPETFPVMKVDVKFFRYDLMT